MKNKKELFLIVIILVISATLRFSNLMHDSPYFFNPDERNMANAISQFRLPSDLSQIPICLISQIRNDPGSSSDCNLNPHFFAYGQFPMYLAFASGIFTRGGLAVLQGLPLNNYLSTSFPQAIFWLRFWSALSSVLTVLIVFLISRKLFTFHFSLFTAAAAAFTPGLIQSAHFGTTESLLTFFFLLSVYISLSYLGNLGHLKFVIFSSLTIGLALGSKLTGVFFFVPPLSSLMVQIIKLFTQRISKKKKFICLFAYLLICLLVLIGSLIVFILSSPYNLVEPENFKSAVFGYEQDVATGKYEAFYTRQFVNTTPLLFQAEKIFPYTLGWPVFILGALGFLLTTVQLVSHLLLFIARKIQNLEFRVHNRNEKIINSKLQFLIINSAFLIYFLPNASLFAKWTRFMTPILPFFSIFAAISVYLIYQLIIKKLNNSFVYLFICLFVITSILPGLMFMSIYSHEDTRVQASKWIYQNIPDNSYILSETANVVDIPVGLTSNSKPHQVCAAHTWCGESRNYQIISFDFYHLDENPALFVQLLNHLEKANYIFIPSRRIFANYTHFPQKFPLITKYYQLLFEGSLGFEKVAEISSLPDESAEETFTVFDHPVIRIYRKTKPFTVEQYRSLFGNRR